MLNLPEITKKLHPARLWCIRLFGAVLCMCCAFNVQAYNCTQRPHYLDMFSGTAGRFFAFPEDLAALPVGTRVGGLREVNLHVRCTGMAPSDKFGTGMLAVSGLSWHAATQTWTNPQLEALGLGFRMWWHEPIENVNHNPTPHPNNNPTIDYPPVNWYNRPSATGNFKISTRVIFFKINNNFQDTDGNDQNVSVNQELFKFYIAEPSAPTTPIVVATYTLNLTKFASMKRVCTPLTNTTINFGTMTGTDMSALGVVESSTQTFSLNFNCPYMAYYMVGFKLEGVYGVLDADNGVFGIKQGAGYASGLGVQFSGQGLATSWRDDQNWQENTWQVLKPNQDYSIPRFEYSSDDANKNPKTSTRQKTVNFRAKYYRMPGILVGGAVESRVLVRLVYQ